MSDPTSDHPIVLNLCPALGSRWTPQAFFTTPLFIALMLSDLLNEVIMSDVELK